MKSVLKYLLVLSYGIVVVLVLLTWNTRNLKNGWLVPITPYTTWVFLSWLLCYPWLRGKLGFLFVKNNKSSKLTSNDISLYPLQYTMGSTRSIGEIFSLTYVLAEHLLISFLLVLFGPLVVCARLLMTLFKRKMS